MISEGWTCQSYVDNGHDMAEYCSKPSWIEDEICGQTCAVYGLITNSECDMSKYFNVNLKASCTFVFLCNNLLNAFILHDFYIHVIISNPSACNVDGAAGDGSTQGTCSDAGQKCNADGTCGK